MPPYTIRGSARMTRLQRDDTVGTSERRWRDSFWVRRKLVCRGMRKRGTDLQVPMTAYYHTRLHPRVCETHVSSKNRMAFCG